MPVSFILIVRVPQPLPTPTPAATFLRQSGSKGQVTIQLSVRAAEHRELLLLRLRHVWRPSEGDLIPGASEGSAQGRRLSVCCDLIWNLAKGKFRPGDG